MPINNAAGDGAATDTARAALAVIGGTIHAFWSSTFNVSGTIGNDRDFLYARSTDFGVTWSAAVAINEDAAFDGADAIEDIYFELEAIGNTLVAAFATQRNNTSGGDIHVRVSHDDGLTWLAETKLGGGEYNVAYLGDLFPVVAGDSSTGRIMARSKKH